MAFVLSENQCVNILILREYEDNTRTYQEQEACDFFNDRFSTKPITKSPVLRTCQRYQETESNKFT